MQNGWFSQSKTAWLSKINEKKFGESLIINDDLKE